MYSQYSYPGNHTYDPSRVLYQESACQEFLHLSTEFGFRFVFTGGDSTDETAALQTIFPAQGKNDVSY